MRPLADRAAAVHRCSNAIAADAMQHSAPIALAPAGLLSPYLQYGLHALDVQSSVGDCLLVCVATSPGLRLSIVYVHVLV